MTRTISIITATVGAALLFAVPAWGDNWGRDQQQSTVRVSPDLADRAIKAEQIRVERMLDSRERSLSVGVGNGKLSALEARERSLGAKNEAQLGSDFYSDGFAQAVQPRDTTSGPVRDDRFRLDPNSVPEPVTATSQGTEIEWPQLGIGFGVGLVLAIGLYLAMRYTRIRPLAH